MVSFSIRKQQAFLTILAVIVLGFGLVVATWENAAGIGHDWDELRPCSNQGEVLQIDTNGNWACAQGGGGSGLVGTLQSGSCTDCSSTSNPNDNWCRAVSGVINCLYPAPGVGSGSDSNAGTICNGANFFLNGDGNCVNMGGGGSSSWATSGNNVYLVNENVGIGTSNPSQRLNVQGNAVVTGTLDAGVLDANSEVCIRGDCRAIWPSGSGGNCGTSGTCSNIYGLSIQNPSSTVFTVNDNLLVGGGSSSFTGTGNLKVQGSVGVGTNPTSATKLSVGGSASVAGDLLTTGGLFATGLTTGSFLDARYNSANGRFYYQTSSKRYKDNIKDLDEDFSKILEVEPKVYTRKDTGDREIGYIAEEFDELGLNELVIYVNGVPESLDYEKVSLYLTEVVKDQQETIEVQQGQIDALTNVICKWSPYEEMCR